MSKVFGTTSASHTVVASKHNEKTDAERDVRAKKVTGLAAETMTDRSMLPPLPFFIQGLREGHDCLDLLLSPYEKLLFHFAGPYASEPQELRMMRREIAKLTNKLASFSLFC